MAKSTRKNKSVLFFFLLTSLVLIILANLIPKIQVYVKRSDASALINFPADHAFHPDFKSEWWYLNLMTKTTNVDGSQEKDLAYVLSFSRIRGNYGLLSSSYDNTTKTFNQKTDIGGNLTTYLNQNQYLFVQYTNGENYMTLQEKPIGADRKRSYKLTGKTDQIGTFNLLLKERTVPSTGKTKPLLWGGNTGNCLGKISVFEPNDTFYYSIPDLDINGTIVGLDGIKRNVKIGKAWMDHQWFNSKPSSDWNGHYWTALHFTQSNDLYNTDPHHAVGFLTQIYKDGPRYNYWVKRNANGTNQCGESGNIAINSYGSTNYPSSWKIKLKKNDTQFLTLNGNLFSDNQIITIPVGFTPIDALEAASFYSGTLNGNPITGLGFFETHLTKPQ